MDHFSGTTPTHPLRRMAVEVSASIKEVEDVDPTFMSADDRAAALAELDSLEDRLHLLTLSVMRASDDLADAAGFRTVSAWRAAHQRRDRRAAAADERLAEALDQRWAATADAIRDGRASLEQARVIVHGLDALADALAEEQAESRDDQGAHDEAGAGDTERTDVWIADVLARGETHLIGLAAKHTPVELARLAEHLLTVVAPDHAEEIERRALERAERRASSRTRLTLRRRGDGTTSLSARIPDLAAHLLKTFLGSLTAPRVTFPGSAAAPATDVPGGGIFGDPGPQPTLVDPWLDPDTGRRIPQERRDGQAFVSLLERVSARHLPRHGGLGTAVTVTIDFASLRDGVGHGTVGDPDGDGVTLSPGEVRRLACASGIAPVVLGADSEVLDRGRLSRFFSAAQRAAHAVGHPTCEALGCTIPAQWCEAHHKRDPWAAGGTTDLADLAFLCPWHHHRAHDPAFRATWPPDGGVRFHRRR